MSHIQKARYKNIRTYLFIVCSVFLMGLGFFISSTNVDLVSVDKQSWLFQTVFALDDVDQLQKEIDDLEKLKKLSEAATTPLENEVKNLEGRINNARAGIASAQKQAKELEASIQSREEELADQTIILYKRVNAQYKNQRTMDAIISFFSANDMIEFNKKVAYHFAVKAQDKKIIETTGLNIVELENDKKELEKRQIILANLSKQLDTQASFFKGEIDKAKKYQQELKGKIADLSAKQQEIMAARSGNFTFNIADGELADEYLSSVKGFRESAPSGYFAIFSFGAYTHRNGMSQYGARARAESGQSAEDILKAYFPNATLKKDYSVTDSINVEGHGSISFEDKYMRGIAEMYPTWHKEALKAQAVAARTFAVRHTDNGKRSICTTEQCQVYRNGDRGGNWNNAVEETKQWVLVDGDGKPISTQFASTHGGYSHTSGWDTKDKSGGSNFIDKSWEKQVNSPWLYKAWWRNGYSNQGNTCGRSNPWLSPEEMADIVNAALALKMGGLDTSRITPVTTSCWGGNPYSMDELKNLVGDRGIKAATSVQVSQSDGITQTVTINGISFSGNEFKNAVCLRAPGYVRIPQSKCPDGSWTFFNIEKK